MNVVRIASSALVALSLPSSPLDDSLSAVADPDFGPNVTIFDSTTSRATIQAKLDSLFASHETSQFGEQRVALLFKPGTYDVDASVGFYTQISGLGLSPDDVRINGSVRADARWRKGNATLNFWRIAENLSVVPDSGFDRWAVSQAAPCAGCISAATSCSTMAAGRAVGSSPTREWTGR